MRSNLLNKLKTQDWLRVKDVVNAALGQQHATREQYVRSSLAGEPELIEAAQSLLGAEDIDDDVLQEQLIDSIHDGLDDAASPAVGETIGAYTLDERIASGGMGTVYRGRRQTGDFEQAVAIKVLRADVPAGNLRRRFTEERRTLARLEHPYIARLIDGGTSKAGVPYLVMEFVNGVPLLDYFAEKQVDLRERLLLFCKICEAVHYLHQNLVIHRDLKPANILVTPDGTPKILDFGIAKLLNRVDAHQYASEATVTGARALTPKYASPEHIKGEPMTTASDIYSLGVILFETLTGNSPYDATSISDWQLSHAICNEQAINPSAAAERQTDPVIAPRTLRGDLDNITKTALRKSPSRRYRSVQAFGEDIERFLAGQPVLARRDTWGYRSWKFVKRNRVTVTALAIGIAALLGGIVTLSIGLQQARYDRQRALNAASEAVAVMDFFGDTLARANPYVSRGRASLIDLLKDADRRVSCVLKDMPGVEARVRLTLAETYGGLWMWPEARDHVARAVRLMQTDRANDPALLCEALMLLSRAYSFCDDQNGLRIARRALQQARDVHGAQSQEYAYGLGLLGFAQWTNTPISGTEAETSYRASINLFERIGGRWTARRARIWFSYGMFLSASARQDEAVPYLRAALDYFREEDPPRDLYLVACLHSYGKLLFEIGQHGEAESVLKECIERIPATFAREKAVDAHRILAYNYFDAGCFEESEAQFKRTAEQVLMKHIEQCDCPYSKTIVPTALAFSQKIDLQDDDRYDKYAHVYDMCHAAECDRLNLLLIEKCIHNMLAAAINHRDAHELWGPLTEYRQDITERIHSQLGLMPTY